MLLISLVACLASTPNPKVHVSADLSPEGQWEYEIFKMESKYRINIWMEKAPPEIEGKAVLLLLQREGPMGPSRWLEQCEHRSLPMNGEVRLVQDWNEANPDDQIVARSATYRITCDLADEGDSTEAQHVWVLRDVKIGVGI